jgi:hypothetical protein
MRTRFPNGVIVGVLAASAALGCESLPTCKTLVVEQKVAPKIDYVLVEYRSGALLGTSPAAEIQTTPTYRSTYANLHTAAIRAPDACNGDTAVQVVGDNSQRDVIMRDVCGPWLHELEASLVQHHYNVISWQVLRSAEKTGTSMFEAAKRSQADVIFNFNSLEVSPTNAGSETDTSFEYFESDETGRKGNAIAVNETGRKWFRKFVRKRVPPSPPATTVTKLSATFDTTAVLVSGESIWFYRRTLTFPMRHGTAMRFLFEHRGEGWYPLGPPGQPAPEQSTPEEDPQEQMATKDVTTASAKAQPDDAYAAGRRILVQTAAKELIERFQSGPGGAS